MSSSAGVTGGSCLLPRLGLACVPRPVAEQDDGGDDAHLDEGEAAARPRDPQQTLRPAQLGHEDEQRRAAW